MALRSAVASRAPTHTYLLGGRARRKEGAANAPNLLVSPVQQRRDLMARTWRTCVHRIEIEYFARHRW